MSVLKAAHHGSRYSNCSEFLEEIAPEYVVISAGEGNRYGHPHEEAVGRMETAGSKILLTMEEGEIVFRVKKNCFFAPIVWYTIRDKKRRIDGGIVKNVC